MAIHINNFRSVTGRTKDHKQIIEGKLYRSGGLRNLTIEDIDMLRAHKIRHVVDIRSDEEKEADPYQLPEDIQVHHISALHTKDGLENFYFFMLIKPDSSAEDIRHAAAFVQEGYLTLPFHNPALKTIFSLMEQDDGAILFHCSSGKDRTGVLAALIQKLFDVEDAYIMQDYLLSNRYVEKMNEKHAKEFGFQGEVKDMMLYCCSVHEELLQSSLDEVLRHYPDWNTYFLQEYGMDEKRILRLKSLYLSDL